MKKKNPLVHIQQCLVFVLCFISTNAFAVKALDFSIHQEYVSTRALGMGNAFTAVADDHSALFYNPAALAFRKDGIMHMYVFAGLDSKYLGLMKDIENASGGDKTEQQKVDALFDLVESNYGNNYHLRAPGLGAFWVRPNWGIAFIPADISINLGIHKQVGPMLNLNAYADSTLAYGYARQFNWFGKNNKFSMGATIKAIHRLSASKQVSAGELATNSNVFKASDGNEGLTFDADIGTLLIPGVPKKGFFKFLNYMKPTFAVVARNVVDYGFTTNLHLIDKNSGQPPNLERRFDFGTKWDVPNFWVFDPHLSFDIRDVGHSNFSMRKGLHVGAELGWKMFNWWKGTWTAGINQGYWTLGLGARLAWFRMDLVTYGEEVGSPSVPNESRRYQAELSLDF